MKPRKIICMFVALAALAGCSKQSKGDQPEPAPLDPIDVEFVVVTIDSQETYIDETFEFKAAGKTISFKLTDMKLVEDHSKYKNFIDLNFLESRLSAIGINEYNLYKYDLCTLKEGESVEGTSNVWTVQDNIPSKAKVSVIQNYALIIDKLPISNKLVLLKGVTVEKDKLGQVAEALSAQFDPYFLYVDYED